VRLGAIDGRAATLYSAQVIKSFAHKGLEAFFTSGSKAGIQGSHAARLARQLAQLHRAVGPHDMALPGWKLHPLKGELAGHWAVSVSGNWRLTFRFDGTDAHVVNYLDYH
jgi:proteic killer suppression protein